MDTGTTQAAGLGTPREEGGRESAEERMEDYYETGTLSRVEEGEVVRGIVVGIQGGDVLVDVGYKSEGTVPLEEFARSGSVPRVGEEIEVFLEAKEDSRGLILLSKEKADRIRVWDVLDQAFEQGAPVDGRVVEVVKGGLTVDLGVRAFLPGSQADLRPVKNLAGLVGTTIRAKVIKLNRRRGNVVLSRRVLLEEDREGRRRTTLETLREGLTLSGVVKNLTDYGAFVDLGGVDGLLHVTDMSWGRVGHPSEIFAVGDAVEVVVLHYDPQTGRVSLGHKQRTPDPWLTVQERLGPGTRCSGRIVSVTNYGAFVELEPGVEGLVHVSEMSWTRRVRHPSKLVNVGDTVDVVVLGVDAGAKRISLGMKQADGNPWATMAARYPSGTRVTGQVRNLTDYGAFIELEDGVDGLLHISDMSWDRSVTHPSALLRKGQDVEVEVLGIDVDNQRISLGLKQLQDDPWAGVAARYPVGARVSGRVVRIADFGAFVELEAGIDGLLHVSQISHDGVAHPSDVLSVGMELTLVVIRVEPAERRIGLNLKDAAQTVSDPAPGPAAQEREAAPGGWPPQWRQARRGRQRRGQDYDDEEA